METTLGEDWQEFFDLIICDAKKPLFYRSSEPLKTAAGVRAERARRKGEDEAREKARDKFMLEAEDKYYKEHEPEMEAYKEWEDAQKEKAAADLFASEEEVEEEGEYVEPPKKPSFETRERQACARKFDEEYAPTAASA
jgi:hypothetical protein